ncbi:dynein heavy chain 17, axonemal-like [Leptonychotes weddellii]|uniref:Dynein heavy chain 17, axonemal-like n=1 Tax=Leptonychotes weddellii TaxID=9713 RepID=A0A2U3Z3F6_LEPWE|nr:dynein heavy chain 17, axonemal-like [Leptonychotes weddellii]
MGAGEGPGTGLAPVESSQAFTWQSQLRHRWDEEKKHCFANICDAQIQYSYEYLGNTPRLVITPLTDRCYITLTQSLHLIMGGAPAGPAGTGKTETTKDLGRALGTMVYVFNCSEQMDYKSCGNIYKGLAQTGAWGCFDEFNRISVEVLSVIAVQVKCVQDAIRAKKKTFSFLGEMIGLIPTVGIFITMNPGYAGRAELPENLKALFRPCAMVVPDFELICEIMLVAEGFLEARLLARKFITLYTLCKELLSKQDHYDWGLRAIKSVLVVAGSLKRGDPSRAEDQVLMRALRDFNIPKIVTDDLPVFMGLIGDLFPALDVPRKRDLNFEKIIKQSIVELKLQAEDSFVLKVVQLEELLQVRHSVFVIGNAGSGKSQACPTLVHSSVLPEGVVAPEPWVNNAPPHQVLKSLNKTYQNMKRKPVAVDLDPKAVTCDELFGIINPATREWKDDSPGELPEFSGVLNRGVSVFLTFVALGPFPVTRGGFIKIGDKEVEYHPKFRLILHTKHFNPHYKPEMQAQCTLINFLVTRDGLEDQLLAAVVAKERPDLEQLKANLTKSQNEFKIVLKELEDSLLARLSAASGNFLGDTALVENLETTKHTASEIEEKVKEAKITEVKINEARENYRPAAERASLLYFILNDLNKINPIYQFSLKAFNVVFEKAIQKTTPAEEVRQRVINLTDEITYSVYMYTARGLFERDKLIFLAQVAFQVLSMKKELNPVELDFLLRFPFKAGVQSPVDFLQHQGWGGIKALSEMDEFKNLDNDIEGSAKRWKKLVESEAPEKEIFPKEWKNKTSLQKLCMVRCMRPDRMTYAVKNFVEEKMGSKFVEGRSVEFSKSYEESSPSTPIFFILSPGVDPLKDVEALGKKLGFTIDNGKLHNVSLGQGQEVVAEDALDMAAEMGHWVILQNIHLVARWLSTLDKKVEHHSMGSHEDYRVFISAEPAPSPESHIIPQGILENAIKITNEPPTGMHANLHKALDLFTQDTLEMCTKEIEFKCILFALCYFHAVVAERRKFGAQGWNRLYPFNNGDLTISINVLYNYLEANTKVPWDDLRYLFGEIMYGGHITDDWDRRLCRTYLAEYVRVEMLEGEILLAPGFQIPPNLDYKGYHEYIDENLPPESPYLYGLHPNAEIGFLTVTSEKLFRTVLEMQPKETDSGAGTGVSREEKVKAVLEEILEKVPEMFNMAEIMAKAAEKTPYVVVAFQECERMNILTNEMRRSLKELSLGLKGELTITTDMEDLSTALFYDTVPDPWVARAYPSMMGLAAWYADLLLRIRELEAWTTDFTLPTTVWLAGFFNPQSFLTAIMQSMARKNEWPLDKMCLSVEVTKKNREDMTAPPREGSYVYGLFMEGARWDTQTGVIAEARLKELTPAMPVIFIKAIPVDRMDTKNIYECPVYKTRIRGPTYVWTFNLKTKEKAAKWILAAVALLLQV